jgi:hypothetical protein
MRMKLLRESIDRTPAIPTLEGNLPSDDAFYDGEISEWTDSSSSDTDCCESVRDRPPESGRSHQ